MRISVGIHDRENMKGIDSMHGRNLIKIEITEMGKDSKCNNGLYTATFIGYEILLYILSLFYDIMKLEAFWWCFFPFILVEFIIWVDDKKESDIRGSILKICIIQFALLVLIFGFVYLLSPPRYIEKVTDKWSDYLKFHAVLLVISQLILFYREIKKVLMTYFH